MKRLWVLPLAAIVCGRPVDPPRLKAQLRKIEEPCLASAQKYFLLTYAYREESSEKSRAYLEQADQKLKLCEEPILRARINELKSSFL